MNGEAILLCVSRQTPLVLLRVLSASDFQLGRSKSAHKDQCILIECRLLPSFLSACRAEFQSRLGKRERVRSVPIRLIWLAWDTSRFCHFWPENLSCSGFCSNYTCFVLFWEWGDDHGLQPCSLCCQMW